MMHKRVAILSLLAASASSAVAEASTDQCHLCDQDAAEDAYQTCIARCYQTFGEIQSAQYCVDRCGQYLQDQGCFITIQPTRRDASEEIDHWEQSLRERKFVDQLSKDDSEHSVYTRDLSLCLSGCQYAKTASDLCPIPGLSLTAIGFWSVPQGVLLAQIEADSKQVRVRSHLHAGLWI